MGKHGGAKTITSVCLSDGVIFLAGAFTSLTLVCSYLLIFSPSPNFTLTGLLHDSKSVECSGLDMQFDPPEPGFYDDPDLRYSIEKSITNWDEKRHQWLELHPTFKPGSENRIVMVTGSQSSPCKNPIGDHLLLRCFKNKVDYARIHSHDIFYSNSLLHPKMNSYWAKLPVVKAAMLAQRRSGSGGLIPTLFSPTWNLNHRFTVTVNITSLRLAKYNLEAEYYFQGYWVGVVGGCANVTERYLEMEREDDTLRRRHAEKVSERYGAFREERFLKGEFGGRDSRRRAFVTHFTGCQPCSGDHNPIYDGHTCWNGMIRALNFADNQMMRVYGYVHSDLSKTSPLQPVPFDYPDDLW